MFVSVAQVQAGRGGASVGACLPVKQFFYSVCFWLGLFAGGAENAEKMLSSHIPNVKSHDCLTRSCRHRSAHSSD